MLVLVPTVFEAVHLFGAAVREPLQADGAVTLRASEREFLIATDGGWTVAQCGFGIAASGVGATHAMARFPEGPVVLAGIAGSYDLDRAPLASVVVATRVTCDGIGAGTGTSHISAGTMGWNQGHTWAGDEPVGDTILLEPPAHVETVSKSIVGEVLSVAAASGDIGEAEWRHQRHPNAVVEEMEGFAVALGARVARRRLTIVRGVSNRAGDRDQRAWRTADALHAVLTAVRALSSTLR